MALRVLVCGGRDFSDHAWLGKVLDTQHAETPFGLLIEGGARGADTLALVWAQRRGIKTVEFPADWKTHGKAAGPIRNQQMLDDGEPDLVIAFPGGAGTADMVRRALRSGIKVIEVGGKK